MGQESRDNMETKDVLEKMFPVGTLFSVLHEQNCWDFSSFRSVDEDSEYSLWTPNHTLTFSKDEKIFFIEFLVETVVYSQDVSKTIIVGKFFSLSEKKIKFAKVFEVFEGKNWSENLLEDSTVVYMNLMFQKI